MKLPASKEDVYYKTDKWCCNKLKISVEHNTFLMFNCNYMVLKSWDEYDNYTLMEFSYCPYCGEQFERNDNGFVTWRPEKIKLNEVQYREFCVLPDYTKDKNVFQEIWDYGK
jgi:hypothetical protein